MKKGLTEGFYQMGSHCGRRRMAGGGHFSGLAVQTDAECRGLRRRIALRSEAYDQPGEYIAAAGLGQGAVAFAFCDEQATICGKEVGDVILERNGEPKRCRQGLCR